MDGDEEEGAGMAHPLLLLPANSPAAYRALSDPSSSEQHQGEPKDALDAAQEDTAWTAAVAALPVAGTSYPQATDLEMGNVTSRALNGVRITAANASSAASGDDAENNPPNVGKSAATAERGGKRRAQDDEYPDESPTGESARYLAGGGALSSQESMPSPSKKARRGQDLWRTPSGLGRADPESHMLEDSGELHANRECAVGVANLGVVAALTPPLIPKKVSDAALPPEDASAIPQAKPRRRSTGTFSHVEIITGSAPPSATLASRTAGTAAGLPSPPPPSSASPVHTTHPIVEVEIRTNLGQSHSPPCLREARQGAFIDEARRGAGRADAELDIEMETAGPTSSQPLERVDSNKSVSSASSTHRRGAKGQRASLEPRRTSGRLSAQLERSTSSAPPTDVEAALHSPAPTGPAARAPLSSTSSSNTEDGAVEVRSSPVAASRAHSSAAKGLSLFPMAPQPAHRKATKTYSSKHSRKASTREKTEAGPAAVYDMQADDDNADREDDTTVLSLLTGIESQDSPFAEAAAKAYADTEMADGASQSTVPEVTPNLSKARKPPSSRRRRPSPPAPGYQIDQSHLDSIGDADMQAIEAVLNEDKRPSRGSRRAGQGQAVASPFAQSAMAHSQKSKEEGRVRASAVGHAKEKRSGKARAEAEDDEETDRRDDREMAALAAERPLQRKRAPAARKGKAAAASADLQRTASETSTSTSASSIPALSRTRSSLYRNSGSGSTTSLADIADGDSRSEIEGEETDEAAGSPRQYREESPESESSTDEGDASDASYGASSAPLKRAAKGGVGKTQAANGATAAKARGARAKKAKKGKNGAGAHNEASDTSPRPQATPKAASKVRTTLPTPTSAKAKGNGSAKGKGKAIKKTASASAFRNHRGHARCSSHSSASPLPNLPAMPFSSQQSETAWNLGLLDDFVWVAVPALHKAKKGKEHEGHLDAATGDAEGKHGDGAADDGKAGVEREAAPTFWWPGRIDSRNRQNFRVTLMLDGGRQILQISSEEVTVAPEHLDEDHLLSYRNDVTDAPVFTKPKEAMAPFLHHPSREEYCTPPESAFVSVMLSASRQASSDFEDEDSLLPEMGGAFVSSPRTAKGKTAATTAAKGSGSAKKRAGGSAVKASTTRAKGKQSRSRKGQQHSSGTEDGSCVDVDTDGPGDPRNNGGGRKKVEGNTEGDSEVDLEFQAQLDSLKETELVTTESESEAEEADPSIKWGDVCLGKDPKSETWWPVRVLEIRPLATRVTHGRAGRVLARPMWEGPYTVEFYPHGEGLLGRKDLKQTDDPGFDSVPLGEVAEYGGGFKITDAHVRKTFPQLARLIRGDYAPGEKRQSLYFGDPRERHRQLPHEIHYGNFSDADEGDVPKVQKCILRWLAPQASKRKGAAAPPAGVEPPPLDAERIADMNGSEMADYVGQVLVPTALELLVIQHSPDISERARAQYAEHIAKQAESSSTLAPNATAATAAAAEDADMAICVIEHRLAVESLVEAKKGAWWNLVYNTRDMRKSHETAQKKITFNANDRNGEDTSGRRRKRMNYKE